MGTEIMRVQDQLSYANAVAKSDIIPQAYRNKPANIMVAIGFGQSIGLSPAESLYRINVIKGKPTMGAELIAAQVRKAGHKLRLKKDEQRQSVTCTIVRADDPDYPISVTRDRAWAESMGLAGNDNYKKQGMTMLTWRAITACAREACPEALYGVAYTPDEMEDMPRSHAPAEPVRVEARVEPAPAPAPADLAPVRARFKDFMAATQLDQQGAMGAICAKAKRSSMDALTPADVAEVCAWMDEKVAEAKEQQAHQEAAQVEPDAVYVPADEPYQPELLDEEVEF